VHVAVLVARASPGLAEPGRPVSGAGARRLLAGLTDHSIAPMKAHARKNASSSPTPAISG
jgi:hypothetical protein